MSGGEGSAKARLFVALDLPESARGALVAWQRREVAPLEGVRAIRPEALHVTLAFLGWWPAGDADRIGELVRGAAAPVGELVLGGVAWLPPRRPRVLAVDLVDEDGRLDRKSVV